MCLTTTFGKGFIAPKDIIVYKQLDKIGDSKWRTPCQGYKVILDSEFLPDRKTPDITEHLHNFDLNGGVIHAYTKSGDTGYYFKAIIRKGTKFWIQDDLSEVAAEKLYITSEKAKPEEETDFSFLYQEYSLDLLLKNGERVSWSPSIDLDDVKGIFVYDSQAIGLEVYRSEFSSSPLPKFGEKLDTREKAENDFSGEERTKILREEYPEAEILKNLSEDSYIPACGELTRALEKFLFINITRKSIGLEPIKYRIFWSSTPYGNNSRWYVNPYWDCWADWYYCYWGMSCVCFLGSPQNK